MIPLHIQVYRFVTKLCLAVGAGGFWGLALALLLVHAFGVSGDVVALYVVLPFTVLFVAYVWPKMDRVLGFDKT